MYLVSWSVSNAHYSITYALLCIVLYTFPCIAGVINFKCTFYKSFRSFSHGFLSITISINLPFLPRLNTLVCRHRSRFVSSCLLSRTSSRCYTSDLSFFSCPLTLSLCFFEPSCSRKRVAFVVIRPVPPYTDNTDMPVERTLSRVTILNYLKCLCMILHLSSWIRPHLHPIPHSTSVCTVSVTILYRYTMPPICVHSELGKQGF